MKIFLFTLSLLLFYIPSFAQGVSISTDNSTADASAMLEVKSTTAGVLVPRMSSSQRTAISSPATGLLVYDTDLAAFYYYTGSAWTALLTSATESDPQVTSSTSNTVPKWNGASLGDGSITDQNYNIGIGTNSPSTRLHVSMDNTSRELDYLSTSVGGMFTFGSGSDRYQSFQPTSSGRLMYVSFRASAIGTYTRSVRIYTGSAGTAGTLLYTGTSTAITTTTLYEEMRYAISTPLYLTAGTSYSIVIDNGASLLLTYNNPYANGNATGNASNDFLFATYMDGAGLHVGGGGVGVGTAAPVSTLEVKGSVGATMKSGLTAGSTHPDGTGMVWRYSTGSGTITLPTASTCTNRTYVILNQTGGSCTISSYRDLSNAAQTTIANGVSLWLMSDGTNWYQLR